MAAVDIPKQEHVFIRGEGGSIFKFDLPLHETITERLAKGYLTRVANAEGDPYVEKSNAPSVVAPPTERPALNAAKKAWVGWAVVKGMTPDDAEALTKTDLIERFGVEPKQPEQPAGTSTEESTDSEENGDDEQETDEPDGADDDSSEDTPE